MNPEDRLFDVLAAEAKKRGGKLPPDVWKATVAAFLAKEYPARAKRSGVTGTGLTDEQWVAQLCADPALEGVDVKLQIAKCILWTANAHRGRKPSRMRIVNWLNRADRTFNGHRQKAEAPERPSIDFTVEPLSEWRGVAQEVFSGFQIADWIRDGKPWDELSRDQQRMVYERL